MKNHLLFITFLLIATGAFAQLTVKPTAGGADSYVYVKDQILYVEGDIALTQNPTATVEASIYLRDNGQLIQGNALAENSGNGQLSVQQNTLVTNAFAYYYWCSPVGDQGGATATADGNQNFGLGNIYEDDNITTGVGTNAVISANIAGRDGFSTPLTISRRWMYIHPTPGTEAESNYTRINASYGAEPGFGFTMKGVNTGTSASNTATTTLDQTYEFRGRPNNGNFSIPVEGPEYNGIPGDPAIADAMMTLTGNPYPSALDLNAVFYDSGNQSLSAFFYYDEDRSAMTHYYSGKPFGYGVWIPLGLNNNDGAYVDATFYIWNSSGTNTGTGPSSTRINKPKRYAPIGQGFMFVGGGDTPGNNPVTIKNSHRVFVAEGTSNSSVFFRPTNDLSIDSERPNFSTNANLPSEADTRTPQTRIYAVFDEALTRDMLLVFSDQATDGYDRGFDGLSPGGMKADAYFPVGEDGNRLPYVINSVNYDENKQIPLAFKLNKTTQIRLSIVEEIKKPYEKIYLYDRQENVFRRLGSQTTYPFSLTLPAGSYDNRFFIVFKKAEPRNSPPTTSIEVQEKIIASVNLFQNNPAKQLEISNPEGYTLKAAAMYDMNGKMVIQKQNLGSNSSYTFYTGNLSEGVYLVKLTTAQDVSIDYKAIVNNQ